MRHSVCLRWLVLAVILLLAGCGSRENSTVANSTQPNLTQPIPSPTIRTDNATLESLISLNLLTAPGVDIACDGSAHAELQCEANQGVQTVKVAVAADGYARWSLHLPHSVLPLSGREILTIHQNSTENLNPNVYLVEESGRRIFVPLSRFGLESGWQEIHIPLLRFVDDEGLPLDFAAVREIQLVFEWSDMQGELRLDSLGFDPIWEETIVPIEIDPQIQVPAGFVIEVVATGGHNLTQIETPTADSLLVSEQTGRIWWYWDDNGDGFYGRRRLYDTGYTEVVGLLYDPVDGSVWIGGRGQLWRTLDSNGNGMADVKELRLDGLPWGRHQNNGLEWNQTVDPFSGEPAYSWIYFGLGSQGDLDGDGDLNATVLRFPRAGEDQTQLEVVSRGNRNAYDVVWAPVSVGNEIQWSLFASENGPDFNDAPDEVNHIRWGLNYGFPNQFGMKTDGQEDLPYTSPLATLPGHASADGLAYVTDSTWPEAYRTLYISLFGDIFGEERVGRTVERVALSPIEGTDPITFQGETSTFIDGLERPLAMGSDSQGRLLVADYVTGIVYRVRYVGP